MQKIRDLEDGLRSAGYSSHQSKNLAKKLKRRLDFEQCAVLFAMDPTALVAALRSLGYDVPAKYAVMGVTV